MTDVTRERVVLIYQLMKGLPVHDVCLPPPRAPHLVCHLVDVTRTKAHDLSSGPILTAIDRQARDDSWMGRMFGMVELQLRICGRPVTKDELETLAESYPLTHSAMHMCRMVPTFQKPIDDDDALLMRRMAQRNMSQMILAPEMMILMRVMEMVMQP
ncbi:hypothetical protein KY284_001215 [Solanum tuberosum]|nr:hypothetical protein KY284_001215 [Solanum tuberosum]